MAGQQQIVIEDGPRKRALVATQLLLADPSQPRVLTIELCDPRHGRQIRSIDCRRPH